LWDEVAEAIVGEVDVGDGVPEVDEHNGDGFGGFEGGELWGGDRVEVLGEDG
jgi:hypothetical protein